MREGFSFFLRDCHKITKEASEDEEWDEKA
jgi:hypothetical protein